MRSISFPRLLAAACCLAGAACTVNANRPVELTHDAALVAGCQKVEEVSVDPKFPQDQIDQELTDQARRKGANYVLIASEGSRSGTAYQCAMPGAGASSSSSR